ncbi:MAG TPA: GNAT family N-acetyltransferase, partial [Tepidisphaeraceae bacterium]|nr:GNAT family N-acetyltransferase [Tepidisphaeraceae bacterium]
RLMAVAEEILADLGFDYAELAVEESGEAARRFYERLDYRLADSGQPSVTGTPSDSAASHTAPARYILRKRLSPPRTRTTIPTSNIVLKDPSP